MSIFDLPIINYALLLWVITLISPHVYPYSNNFSFMTKPTHVNVVLDGKSNEMLEASAKRNNRSKRKEAQARLVDHLSRFDEMGMGLKGKEKA